MPRDPRHAKDYAKKDFGKYLKHCRDLNEINQADMAERLGITQQSVSAMERGSCKISIDRVYEINQIMPLDMIQILKATGYKMPAIRDYFRDFFKDHI